eukprot:scaffold2944_cov60-Phaeocystis_antarctica.AAC.3
MPAMFVTLDVSKLSGWLNASASCRESKRSGAGRGIRIGGPRAMEAQAACRGGLDYRLGVGHGEVRT